MGTRKNGIGRKLAAAALALVAGTTGGCMSTMATLEDPVPYAGTQLYGQTVAKELPHEMAGTAIGLVDLPATMALDTLLLPITIPAALSHGHGVYHERPSYGFIPHC